MTSAGRSDWPSRAASNWVRMAAFIRVCQRTTVARIGRSGAGRINCDAGAAGRRRGAGGGRLLRPAEQIRCRGGLDDAEREAAQQQHNENANRDA